MSTEQLNPVDYTTEPFPNAWYRFLNETPYTIAFETKYNVPNANVYVKRIDEGHTLPGGHYYQVWFIPPDDEPCLFWEFNHNNSKHIVFNLEFLNVEIESYSDWDICIVKNGIEIARKKIENRKEQISINYIWSQISNCLLYTSPSPRD